MHDKSYLFDEPEPYFYRIRVKYLCLPIAALFILENFFQIYLAHINFYQRDGKKCFVSI